MCGERWAKGATAAIVVTTVVAVALRVANRHLPGTAEGSEVIRSVVGALAFGLLGGLLAARRPSNVVGPVCLLIGGLQAVAMATLEYAVRGLAGAGLPGDELAAWVSLWMWAPAYTLVPTVLVLLVPTGTPPSPRWRPVLVLAVLGNVLAALGWALLPYDRRDAPLSEAFEGLVNPVGTTAALAVVNVAFPLLVATALLGVTSLVVRFRSADQIQRQQLKAVAIGAAATLALLVGALTTAGTGGALVAAAMVPLPAALTVAVLRYRLWDVDLVISRSIVYAALTAVVVGVYAVVVTVLGGVLGRRTGAPLVATVGVAIGVQPLRARLQRAANRFLFGDRDDPYTAMARLGGRLESAATPADALRDTTDAVRRALRVPYVELRVPGWGTVSSGEAVVDVETVELAHQGTAAGTLVVGRRTPGEPLGAADRRLLDDLARQVGVAAHAARLQRELQASRERIVLAREEERRRLRHDLHDDIGPTLAAIALQLETLPDVLDDRAAAEAAVARLTAHLQASVGDVRRVVDDLRPAALDDLGLADALAEQVAKFRGGALEIDLDVDRDLGPLPAAVDVAAYRIATEALTNVARHAAAARCTVRIARRPGALEVQVADDGAGIPASWHAGVGLRSMHERASELGGTCSLESTPGRGTVVLATLPLEAG